MKDDSLYVEQMLDAVHKICTFTSGVDFITFEKNQEKSSAVILQLAVIGELSKRLSEEFKSRVSLPWSEIAGFRNRAIHEYLALDLDDVWKTVENDIPELQIALEGFGGSTP